MVASDASLSSFSGKYWGDCGSEIEDFNFLFDESISEMLWEKTQNEIKKKLS